MNREITSLKAKIRNIANEKDISAQVILQNYMFERFLERLSHSDYKNNFIIKGGLLIAALVGIDNRATMDMDVTVKNYPVNADSLEQIIPEICDIDINDGVVFSFVDIRSIRADDKYGGFRVGINANYGTIRTPLSIDITVGDVITPGEIHFSYQRIFEKGTISIWAYNIETVLAEKVETILRRGELNTRPRDFYDIYILLNTQKINNLIFTEALKNTMVHRESLHLLDEIDGRIKIIEESKTLKERWIKYTKSYPYSKDIFFEETVSAMRSLIGLDIKKQNN